MKKEFLNRVLREIVVMRLPIDDLDTTAAINGWETICKIEK